MSVSILVVDDETDVAELFRQHFRREPRQGTYVLHFAYSGEEALDKLCTGIETRLRVILSDINMPVMDGLELLRQIKTRRPDLPVMMVTAYGDDERGDAWPASMVRPNSSQSRSISISWRPSFAICPTLRTDYPSAASNGCSQTPPRGRLRGISGLLRNRSKR